MEKGKDDETLERASHETVEKKEEGEEELRALLLPDIKDLPPIPPSAVESNFVRYFAGGTSKSLKSHGK